MLGTILLVFAFVFFVIATFVPYPGAPAPAPVWGRFNLVSAGLACWVATQLFASFHR